MPAPFDAIGVGHKPEPVSLVRGSNIGRAETTPLRIEPERGQVSEHSSKPLAWSFRRATKQS